MIRREAGRNVAFHIDPDRRRRPPEFGLEPPSQEKLVDAGDRSEADGFAGRAKACGKFERDALSSTMTLVPPERTRTESAAQFKSDDQPQGGVASASFFTILAPPQIVNASGALGIAASRLSPLTKTRRENGAAFFKWDYMPNIATRLLPRFRLR